ncbi:MAG TPA: ROK family protein [Trebonia sp.]|nr:ROK family protein [Trebonia sp.]
MSRVLAIDVGGTTIKAAVTDAGGARVASAAVPTPRGDAAVGAVAALGRRLIAAAGPVTAAGVLLPGIVDPDRRMGVYSANVGWSDLEFGGPLDDAWRVPVGVGHDVTWAGRAEGATGAAREASDFAFVALGTGISAAIMSGGRMLARPGAQPGELGHVVVRHGGPPCSCGARGCLEAIASARAIAAAYGVASAREVFLAAADDAGARRVIKDATDALADGLALLVALVAPQRIILGGGLSLAGAALAEPVARALAGRVRVQPVPDVVLAAHGDQAGLAGAALLARGGHP